MRKVLYTAVFGHTDSYPILRSVPDDWDYICFTSEELVESDVWKTVKCKRIYGTPKDARYYKVNPHIVLPEYDISVWVDACILLQEGWNKKFINQLEKYDISFLKHWEGVKSVFHEARRCISRKKDAAKPIEDEVKFLRDEGLPADIPVMATGIAVRRHNEEKVVRLSEEWWKMIKRFSYRDQISLPYAIWKSGAMPGEMLRNRKGSWFVGCGHKVMRRQSV